MFQDDARKVLRFPVGAPVGDEFSLIHSVRERENRLAELDHVTDVEMPTPALAAVVRHGWPPFRRRASARLSMPCP